MDIAKRIAQFENMAQADPSNEMAHFSLGRAYGDAGRYEEAAGSFMRCIQLVPDMSTAFQMAGEMLLKADKPEQAGLVLTDGYTVAAERGDFKPKKAMADHLIALGIPVPEVKAKNRAGAGADAAAGADLDPNAPVPAGMMRDAKTGRIGTPLARPPFRGPVGEWIAANISKETFSTWIAQGTKVINELRLDLSKDKDQETYDQQMREYLGVPLEDKPIADQPSTP